MNIEDYINTLKKIDSKESIPNKEVVSKTPSNTLDYIQEGKKQNPPKKSIKKQEVIIDPNDPLNNFLIGLSKKLEENISSNKKPKVEEVKKEPVHKGLKKPKIREEDKQFKEATLSFINSLKEKDEEKEFKEEALSLINSLKNKDEEKEFKEETLSLINTLKTKEEPVEVEEVKEENISKKDLQEDTNTVISKEEISLLPKAESEVVESVQNDAQPEDTYVDELKKIESSEEKEDDYGLNSNIKAFILNQIKEHLSKNKNLNRDYVTGGGGGSNAVQYARGGKMNGNLTVTGYISSGTVFYGDGAGLINVGSDEVTAIVESSSANWDYAYDVSTAYSIASSTFLTSETDSQLLSFDNITKDLSISNGNTISLSSLVDTSEDMGVRALTGEWESTYSTVQLTSSSWNRISISDPLKFTFTGNNIQTEYTIFGTNSSSNASIIQVFVENVRQNPYVSYTLSLDVVRFTEPPDEGANIVIITPNIKLLDVKNNEYSIPYVNAIEGKSAYQIWRDLGNFGDEQDFLNSIKGEQGNTGDSAYIVWVLNGNIGNELDFLNSLKGQDGLDGQIGPTGKSAYEIWSETNTGTQTDFLNSLKGETGSVGETGKSAYDIWISTGNEGTQTDFLSILKGDQGEKGEDGTTVVNTDYLTEGINNLFYRSNRVVSDSPVKSVATKTGDIILGIGDITGLETSLKSKQITGNYVELIDGLIPSIYLPGSVDEIQEYTNFHLLTSTGTELLSVLYLTLDTNKVYRWSGSVYVEIVGSPGTTDNLVEGNNNKYFTTERASDAAPVQSVANKTGNVLLEIQDIQNLQPSLTSTNTTTIPITAKLASNLGAYSNDTVIPANTPFEVILRNLLTTVIPAVYTQPTLSVSVVPSTLSYEIGTNISPTLTPNFNKGSAGNATQFRIKSGAIILSSTSTSTPLLTSFQLNANTTFTTEVDYSTGPQLYDNVGNPSGTPIPSGTKTATTTFTTFRNNYYTADTTTTAASDSTKVRSFENSTTSRSFNINIQAGDKRVSFAFPSSLSNINVQIVQIGVGNITTAFTNTTVSVAGANNSNSTNYRVYTYLVPAGYPQAETYSVSF